MKRACDVCGVTYEAKRATSKFCSTRCRNRHQRGAVAIVVDLPLVAEEDTTSQVALVRAELAAAGRLDTWLGGMAIQLAKRVDGATAVMGYAALTKDLRTTMVEALKGAPRAADGLDELEQRRRDKFASA